MAWPVLAFGLIAAGLVLFNTVTLQRRRGEAAGWTPWAWMVILSRLCLVLPFLALVLTAGRWPGYTLLTWWFGLSALFMLVADTGDRVIAARAIRNRQNPPSLD